MDREHSTISREIKRNIFPVISKKTHLRRKGKKITKGNKAKYASIKPEHTIYERPAEVETCSRYGDLEGDTILGVVGKGAIVIMVNRESRYLVAGRSIKKTVELVRQAITASFKLSEIEIPVETLTWDNGASLLNLKRLKQI